MSPTKEGQSEGDLMPRTKKLIDPKHSRYLENQHKLSAFWGKEAEGVNRELAKARDNGKTEYVKDHMRGTKKVLGYFRKPPPRQQPHREITESKPDGAVRYGVCEGPYCNGTEKHWLFNFNDDLWCEGCIDEAHLRAHDIDAMNETLSDDEIAQLDEDEFEHEEWMDDYSQG